MCDTLYKKTSEGYLFAKNSDRSANEPNLSVFIPHQMHKDETLRCTYIEIPQVMETYGMVLVKPSWMWGAEMGINEYGVSIGNEAVFTKSKGKKQESLIGMDYLRLGLERSKTAKDALDLMIRLLETYGQGGNCGFDKPFYYDNSYLIADRKEAYILETSGRQWAFKKIEDRGNISNRLGLGADVDSHSKEARLPFAKRNTEPIFTFFSRSKDRGACVLDRIQENPDHPVRQLMSTLRSHSTTDETRLYHHGSIDSVCMHQSMLGDHTTSSVVFDLSGSVPILWMTSSSTPCLALYKPVFFGIDGFTVYSREEDAFSYWLDQEQIRRAIYAGLIDAIEYRTERDRLENLFFEMIEKMPKDADDASRQSVQRQCAQLETEWLTKYKDIADEIRSNSVSGHGVWKKKNQLLGNHVFDATLKGRVSER